MSAPEGVPLSGHTRRCAPTLPTAELWSAAARRRFGCQRSGHTLRWPTPEDGSGRSGQGSAFVMRSADIWRFEDVLPRQFRAIVHQGLHEVRTGEALDGVLSRLRQRPPPAVVQGVHEQVLPAVLRRECPAVPRAQARTQGRGPGAPARARAGAAPPLRRAPPPPQGRPRGVLLPVEAGPAGRGRPVRGLRQPGLRAAPSRLQQPVPRRAAVPPLPHGPAFRRVAPHRRRAGQVSRGIPRDGGGHPPSPLGRGQG